MLASYQRAAGERNLLVPASRVIHHEVVELRSAGGIRGIQLFTNELTVRGGYGPQWFWCGRVGSHCDVGVGGRIVQCDDSIIACERPMMRAPACDDAMRLLRDAKSNCARRLA